MIKLSEYLECGHTMGNKYDNTKSKNILANINTKEILKWKQFIQKKII
jgi:hypothetical protein